MILGIIQARMGSTRLPGKTLKKVAGIPLVELVSSRVSRASMLDKIVIASTSLEEDRQINPDFVYDGDPNDVLGRFHECAKHFGADIIVRITADDPMKDPDLIDWICNCMLQRPGLEFCSNTLTPTFPWGLDIEAIRFKTLKWLHENVQDDVYREHVTYYILEHPDEFKTYNIEYPEDLHDWKWSIDTQADLDYFNKLFRESGFDPVTVGYEEVIRYVKTHRQRAKVHTASAIS